MPVAVQVTPERHDEGRTQARREVDIFHLVMIKPSHYDDDGYPIQWLRSAIPSNTLACLNGLAEDAQRRAVLGAGRRDPSAYL